MLTFSHFLSIVLLPLNVFLVLFSFPYFLLFFLYFGWAAILGHMSHLGTGENTQTRTTQVLLLQMLLKGQLLMAFFTQRDSSQRNFKFQDGCDGSVSSEFWYKITVGMFLLLLIFFASILFIYLYGCANSYSNRKFKCFDKVWFIPSD